MARNRYPGNCVCCGKYVPVDRGVIGKTNDKWTVTCFKCFYKNKEVNQVEHKLGLYKVNYYGVAVDTATVESKPETIEPNPEYNPNAVFNDLFGG